MSLNAFLLLFPLFFVWFFFFFSCMYCTYGQCELCVGFVCVKNLVLSDKSLSLTKFFGCLFGSAQLDCPKWWNVPFVAAQF